MEKELEIIKKVLEREKNVAFAYVYGSFGRKEKNFRDIDIAVFLKTVPKDGFGAETRLARKLEGRAGKPVEVRTINSMPLLLKSRLMKEGRAIFARNRQELLNFETSSMCECLDFSHLMKEFDERRLERYGIR